MANKPEQDQNPLDKFMDRFKGSSGDGGRGGPDPGQRKVHFSIWYFLAAFLLIVWFQSYVTEQQSNRITYSEFKQYVRDGQLETVTIAQERITGTLKDARDQNRYFQTARVEDPDLVRELEAQGIKYSGAVESKWLGVMISWLLPLAVLFFFWSFLMRRMGGGTQGVLSVGKAKVKIYAE
ncbi:MAG: ATP-dependent metallopeptidase FtsH/Yme1/Tma family protein, partial [Syntrophobacteraceae bacterium]